MSPRRVESMSEGVVQVSPEIPVLYWSAKERADRHLSLQNEVRAVVKNMFVRGVDYGPIPGFQGVHILKPGAQKLLIHFGLVGVPRTEITYGDGDKTPEFTFVSTYSIHVGDTSGKVIAVATGLSSSFEDRVKYRVEGGRCPSCDATALARSSEQYGGGFYCNAKNGGCGKKFQKGNEDAETAFKSRGKVRNLDVYNAMPSLATIAEKRALSSAIDGIFPLGNCLEEIFNSVR